MLKFFLPLVYAAALPAATCNVRDFGALGDGTHKDTAAFAKAIAACATTGGVVHVPPGRYLSGAIELVSNLRLDVGDGATLLASTDPADYPLRKSPWQDQQELGAFIYGENLHNVTISGRGTIDGLGQQWWKRQRWLSPRKNDPKPTAAELEEAKKAANGRPRLIKLVNCRNVWIEGLYLTNSPSWTVNPVFCEHVVVTGITIYNPVPSPNTDGINPESCRNVHISNCNIDVGDDCVTIKSGKDEDGRRVAKPCENITVTNCTMLAGHGGVVVGSEMSGGVRNVAVSNCVFQGTNIGIRLKSQRGRGGVVEGVVVDNIVMQDVPEPITITTFYQGSDTPGETQSVNAGTPQFRDIRISNVTARGAKSAGQITGLRELPISAVSLANVRIAAGRGFSVRNASNISFHNVTVEAQQGASLAASNVERLEVDGWRGTTADGKAPVVSLDDVRGALVREAWPAGGAGTWLRLSGKTSRAITLSNNHWAAGAPPLEYAGGATAAALTPDK